MQEPKKFQELNKEQQSAVRKAGKKYVISGLLTGANHGGLLVMANLTVILANGAFFNSTPLMFVLCVIADMTILRMLGKASRANSEEFKAAVKTILEQK